MLKIHFLGTAASIPTKDRNTMAIYFEHDYDVRFLMDCGECCQKQLISKGLKFMRINHIFITHWHADHFAGLIGLIQTMSLEGRKKPLHIYGPYKTKEFLEKLIKLGHYSKSFEVIAHELKDGDVVEFERFYIKAVEVKHRIHALAYVFEEKPRIKANMEKAKKYGLRTGPLIGKLKNGETIEFKGQIIKPEDVIEEIEGLKVAYTGDTKYFDDLPKKLKDVDVIIAEATLQEKDKTPDIYHMSAKDAAILAKNANAKKLILTHISRRYSKEEELNALLEEAKQVFSNVELSYDGMEIILKK